MFHPNHYIMRIVSRRILALSVEHHMSYVDECLELTASKDQAPLSSRTATWPKVLPGKRTKWLHNSIAFKLGETTKIGCPLCLEFASLKAFRPLHLLMWTIEQNFFRKSSPSSIKSAANVHTSWIRTATGRSSSGPCTASFGMLLGSTALACILMCLAGSWLCILTRSWNISTSVGTFVLAFLPNALFWFLPNALFCFGVPASSIALPTDLPGHCHLSVCQSSGQLGDYKHRRLVAKQTQ